MVAPCSRLHVTCGHFSAEMRILCGNRIRQSIIVLLKLLTHIMKVIKITKSWGEGGSYHFNYWIEENRHYLPFRLYFIRHIHSWIPKFFFKVGNFYKWSSSPKLLVKLVNMFWVIHENSNQMVSYPDSTSNARIMIQYRK